MRHTFFGNLPGRFEGSGWHLLVRGLPLWAFAVVPIAIGAVATILAIDWSALSSAGGADDRASWLETSGLAGAVVIVALTGAWLLLSIVLLYPIFQAIVLRWWVSGLRFGDVAVRSRLRIAQVFGVYARFFGYAALFSVLAGTLIVLGAFGLPKLFGASDSMRHEIITTIFGLGAYVAIALGYSTIYQATVKLGLWRCVIESLDLSNLTRWSRWRLPARRPRPSAKGLPMRSMWVGYERARYRRFDHLRARNFL